MEKFSFVDLIKFLVSSFIVTAYPFSIKGFIRAIKIGLRMPKILRQVVSNDPAIKENVEELVGTNTLQNWAEKKGNVDKSRGNDISTKIFNWAKKHINQYSSIFRDFFPRWDYLTSALIWYQKIFNATHPDKIFSILQTLVDDVLQGEKTPYLINLKLQKYTNSDLTNYLRAGDYEQAFLSLENDRNSILLPHDTAVIHLILRGEGTYALITYPDLSGEIILIPEFSRESVIKLLKGWLWLYFWYTSDMREKMGVTQEAMQNWLENTKITDPNQMDVAKDYVLYKLHLIIQNNQSIFEEYHPIEIPEEDRHVPFLPLPVWILMSLFQEMLGKGHSWCSQGLWKPIQANLKQHSDIKKLIVCPDPALAIFPHHAATLTIDTDGQRKYLQDLYEISYLPWGHLNDSYATTLSEMIMFGDQSIEFSEILFDGLSSKYPYMMRHLPPKRMAIREALMQPKGFLYFGHAFYDWNDPLATSVKLSEGLLSINNFSNSNVPIELAVFASCDTGMPISKNFSFEYQNITSYMIKALKCNSIVVSSWGANPLSTFLLVRHFANLLMQQIKSGIPVSNAACAALNESQSWLRNLTTNDAITELEGILNSSDLTNRDEIIGAIEKLRQQYINKPFAHPYFWSSFYFIGRPV